MNPIKLSSIITRHPNRFQLLYQWGVTDSTWDYILSSKQSIFENPFETLLKKWKEGNIWYNNNISQVSSFQFSKIKYKQVSLRFDCMHVWQRNIDLKETLISLAKDWFIICDLFVERKITGNAFSLIFWILAPELQYTDFLYV